MNLSRIYEDDEQEMASIMGWLTRRLEWATDKTLPFYVTSFKTIWLSAFGTLDNVPPVFVKVINDRAKQLNAKKYGKV